MAKNVADIMSCIQQYIAGSAAAVHIRGGVFIERGHALGKVGRGDFDVHGTGQMAGGKLLGPAHVHEHRAGLAHTLGKLGGREVVEGRSGGFIETKHGGDSEGVNEGK